MKENCINSKFTDEQIIAYAKNFREGDAIWVDDKWCEVITYKGRLTLSLNGNPYIINRVVESGYAPTPFGFREKNLTNKDDTYRVTTLEHYDVQEGDKVVWLGETGWYLTFGKSYTVTSLSNRLIIFDSEKLARAVTDKQWGVIPTWENVKSNDNLNDIEQEDGLSNVKDNPKEQNNIRSDKLSKVVNLITELMVENVNNDNIAAVKKLVNIVEILYEMKGED